MNTPCLPRAYHCLLTAGLALWVAPLMQFLHQYEGIEAALEPDHQPLVYLNARLVRIPENRLEDKEHYFFNTLSTLPSLYYRVSCRRVVWQPANETFSQFKQRMDAIRIWQAWTPQLSHEAIIDWLYAQLDATHAR